MGIQVCLISWMNFDSKENGGKKAFLANASVKTVYPNEKTVLIVPNHQMNGDYCEYPCLSPLIMNIDSKENSWKKAFLMKPTHHCHLSQ